MALSPKAFDVLQLLVARHPAVVSAQEIMAAIWGGTHVTPASVNVLMSEVRRVLGDSSKPHRYIRTAHRRGYAFCGELDSVVETRGSPFSLHCDGKRHSLPLGDSIIGRANGLAIRVDHRSVSRLHARIIATTSGVAIEDLRSTNGTTVLGARIATLTAVRPGDTIMLGEVALKLDGPPSAASVPTDRVTVGVVDRRRF